MTTATFGHIPQVPSAFTPDQVRGFSERDVGRTIMIMMRPALYAPVQARLCSVHGHIVPLFAFDENAATKVVDSVSLKDAGTAAEFLAETQQAIIALRTELSELDRLGQIAAHDKAHLEQARQTVADSGKKRGPGKTRANRFKAAQKAADQLAGVLGTLTELDRLDLEERSAIDRPRLDAIAKLMASLSAELKMKGQRGAPTQHRHEHDFVSELAINFYRFVGEPSHTRESATEGYLGPFEKYVHAANETIRSDGIKLNLDIPYLVRSAADRVKKWIDGG